MTFDTNQTTTNKDRVIRLIDSLEQDLRNLRQLLASDYPDLAKGIDASFYQPGSSSADQSVEGIFDGERMMDENGKCYQVSPNYASKSKLVEGDPLKLYITPDGKYFYKQLGPVARKTVPGTLRQEGNHYVVDTDDGNTYSILTAAVTYYMSLYNTKAGDRIMVIIPADRPAHYAAIENIL